MLSDTNVRKINDQIRRELQTVESFTASDTKKLAAIKRIAQLKELLSPEQPARQGILKELASALIEAREETRNRNQPVDFIEAIFGIRR